MYRIQRCKKKKNTRNAAASHGGIYNRNLKK